MAEALYYEMEGGSEKYVLYLPALVSCSYRHKMILKKTDKRADKFMACNGAENRTLCRVSVQK